VLKGTGKNWDQWMKLLDQAGAGYWNHQEIVAHLKRKHRLTAWWQQGVTLGYEYHKGRRIEGMSLKGTFSLTATKTLPLPQAQVWKLLVSSKGQVHWLKPLSPLKIATKASFECDGGIFGQVRTFKAPLRLRITWQETEWPKPSTVQIHVVSHRKDKSVLVITHEGLKDGRLRTELRAHWKKTLGEFAEWIKAA